jgi:fatty-acid peroxygenase
MHPADLPRSVAGRRIPRIPAFDSTLDLKRDPYGFIAKRCRRSGEDLFEARILLRQTICMTGPEAAALFYDGERFQRKDAAPLRLQAILFGRKGVQTLDGEAHRARKHMFMTLMRPENLRRLGDGLDDWLRIYARKWERMGRVELYGQAREILCRTVCDWAGVPLPDADVALRTEQLSALFESAGRVGLEHWAGRLARLRAQRWASEVLDRIRSGRLQVPTGSAAQTIAMHRGYGGRRLDRRSAAVELINVLRPTVAVAVYIAFEALALQEYPECRQKLRHRGNEDYVEWFVQEVRRFYPFFPSLVARVRSTFDWKGYTFPKGRRVILDLYGTNRDPRAWERPEEFRPERFAAVPCDSFAFIPQGGGDHETGHRCAGEWMTIELMKRAARFLANGMNYDVPSQDLSIDMARLPALPGGGFIMSNVRARHPRPQLVSAQA